MRVVLPGAVVALAVLLTVSDAYSQQSVPASDVRAQAPSPSPPVIPSSPGPAAIVSTPSETNCPGNSHALGVSRTVEIDTTGAPLFGSTDAKQNDFLQPGEIVLTFDDSPWKGRTPKVLAALARHCTKATFFAIGKHSVWYPDELREIAAAGHTIGWHTWSHKNLAKLTEEEGETEIELGLATERFVIGDAVVPFFRFPGLRRPEAMVTYLARRNVAIWSADIDSMDYRLRNSKKVIASVMSQITKRGKGIILMHDFQQSTADGIDILLDELQAHGFKVVAVRAKGRIKSLPAYDAMLTANTDFQCSRAGKAAIPSDAPKPHCD